jgi:CDP-glycerol glycerophosphotransferase (TagB/SpsB family)
MASSKMKKLLFLLLSFLNKVISKNSKQIVYYTLTDLTDNGFAFFVYMSNYHQEYKNIWIIDEAQNVELYTCMIKNHTESNNFIFVDKKSIKALYYYLSSKYVFITNYIYSQLEPSENHIITNLWHGMPLKKIGFLAGREKVQKQSYITVTSEYYQKVMSNVFGISENNILITGQARNDFLFKNYNIMNRLGINTHAYKKIIIWMPTFRTSSFGEIRTDGLKKHLLPVLNSEKLLLFNTFLQSESLLCLVKLHPFDSTSKNDLINMSNIIVLDNDILQDYSIQLNSLLGECDMLMTDYSSVFIDYMLLKRPIILLADDISEYENSRGFIESDIRNFMPVEFTETYEDLIIVLNQIINNNYQCNYRNEKLFNQVTENFSENIYLNVIKPHE